MWASRPGPRMLKDLHARCKLRQCKSSTPLQTGTPHRHGPVQFKFYWCDKSHHLPPLPAGRRRLDSSFPDFGAASAGDAARLPVQPVPNYAVLSTTSMTGNQRIVTANPTALQTESRRTGILSASPGVERFLCSQQRVMPMPCMRQHKVNQKRGSVQGSRGERAIFHNSRSHLTARVWQHISRKIYYCSGCWLFRHAFLTAG